MDLTGAATETINLEASRRLVTVDGWKSTPPQKPRIPREQVKSEVFFVLIPTSECYIWVFLKIMVLYPKSSILIGFSLYKHHPFWGTIVPLFSETSIEMQM